MIFIPLPTREGVIDKPAKCPITMGIIAMYTQTTHNIKITVRPTYLPQESSPAENNFVWAYHVRIENQGDGTVQLRGRHWIITDALGHVREVEGSGVVGEQPVLNPGDAFEYTSGTPLPTPSGIMAGTYEMENRMGERFLVEIPAFSLDSPHQERRLN